MIGVEKNNDDARRHFMYSNRHDAAKEVLLTEARLVKLGPTCGREKRAYHKTNNEYREKGILKKRRRTSDHCDQ